MDDGKGVILFLLLAGCSTVAGDAGCVSYGEARLSMPDLGLDPVSQWVAVTDSRMTGACR